MSPEEYAEKAIEITPLAYRQDVPIEEAADVIIRFGYPEPKTGVTIFAGKRGMTNYGIDWGVKYLRKGISELIEHVAEDCISVVNNLADVDDETKAVIAKAIRARFEIVVH